MQNATRVAHCNGRSGVLSGKTPDPSRRRDGTIVALYAGVRQSGVGRSGKPEEAVAESGAPGGHPERTGTPSVPPRPPGLPNSDRRESAGSLPGLPRPADPGPENGPGSRDSPHRMPFDTDDQASILGVGDSLVRRPRPAVLLLLVLAVSAAVESRSEPDAPPARAARAFGEALVRPDAAGLRAAFPHAGKVRLSLRVLGPEDGLYGPGQAEAVFRELLTKTAVRSFDVSRVESDGRTGGLAILRLVLTDRDGHDRRVGLRLTLEPERGTWVVREVREAPE